MNKAGARALRPCLEKTGGDLLSHTLSGAVPSALEGLTSLFGMGRGVSPPPLPPQIVRSENRRTAARNSRQPKYETLGAGKHLRRQ